MTNSYFSKFILDHSCNTDSDDTDKQQSSSTATRISLSAAAQQIVQATPADQQELASNEYYTIQMKPQEAIRKYQHELAAPGIKGENYIVVAPTNSGKTLVAALIIANHLEKNPQKRRAPKVAVVVKTRPLADQQRDKLAEYIPCALVQCRTGNRDIQERQQQLHVKDALLRSDVVVCTAGKLKDELKRNMISLQDFSLMIIDECHNAEKSSNYAQIMYTYLEQKAQGSQLPQVVGLTATPGVGKNPGLNQSKAVDNLIMLCAHMDASSGIQTVQQHVAELNKVIRKPDYHQEVVDQNERRQAFIQRVEKDMKECEKFLNFDTTGKLPRWSQRYEHAVKENKKPLEENENPDDRDKISTIRLLERYSQTLICYMELPLAHAMISLEKYDDLTSSDKLSDHEKHLLESYTKLKSDLKSLDLCENPILEKLKERLTKTFQCKPESEGIVFVRTREQADAISGWIADSEFAEKLNIQPHMLLGHKQGDEGPSMSDEEQKIVVEAFHSGEYNLLITTSVAEEGLDVKRCNLVMRLHISSAKSKAQVQGRARAEDSEIVTIVSNDPRTLYRDMLNDELLLLMEKLIQNNFLPSPELMREKVALIQVEIRESLKRERELEAMRRSTHPAQNVELKCKKCKRFACRGSDIYVIDNTNHHVVPGDVLHYELIEHSDPGIVKGCGSLIIEKNFKVHCTECNTSWGILGTWPSKKEFPILKCDSFNFFVNGRRVTITRWKDRTFKVSPLSEWFGPA